MRSLLHTAFAIAVAALLVVPRPAAACDGDHPTATTTAHKDCSARCPHAAAMANKQGTAGASDVVPAVQHEGGAAAGAGCPYAKAATAAGAGGHACCPHAAQAKLVATADASSRGRELLATGKVVCARCDLKQSESCKSVFQQAESKATYPLCDEAMTEQLLKLTRHGELEVTVHGRVSRPAGGDEVLCVDGFSVGTI